MNGHICCDTCPYSPTCEEERDFLADIGLAPKCGQEYDDDSMADFIPEDWSGEAMT
jgi:hypothetical protein